MIPDNYFLTYLLHIYFISWRLKKIILRKWKISRFLVVCESHYTINVTTCFTWNYPPKISISKISSKAHHFKDKFWSCFRELYFFLKNLSITMRRNWFSKISIILERSQFWVVISSPFRYQQHKKRFNLSIKYWWKCTFCTQWGHKHSTQFVHHF